MRMLLWDADKDCGNDDGGIEIVVDVMEDSKDPPVESWCCCWGVVFVGSG